ncbi:hypothetical protein D3C81_2009880 [compost metagenome]
MGNVMKPDLFGDSGNRPGGLQKQALGLFNTVVLQIGHRRHSIGLQHAFGQIIGMIVQFFLQKGIVDVPCIVMANEQFHLLGQLNRGSIGG